MTEKIIKTIKTWHGITEVIEKTVFEERDGNKYKVTTTFERITKNVPFHAARRATLPHFGSASLPGNAELTSTGPEIFIETFPYKKSGSSSIIKKSTTKYSVSGFNWGEKTATKSTSSDKPSDKPDTCKDNGGFASWIKKNKSENPDHEWKRTLFVSNIPTSTDRDLANDYIRQNSEERPTRVHVIKNRDTDKCYGNMIVVFRTISSAKQCLSDINGKRWDRNIIHAQISKPKKKR
jgi:hypothetical protein